MGARDPTMRDETAHEWGTRHPVVRGSGVERRCSAWNIHLYVTKKCGKRRFLWIVALAGSLIAREGPRNGLRRESGPFEKHALRAAPTLAR